ncbi:AAA family ATPase [Gordonia sp. KTR9]|uniref:AAA family ATPase n=1 Tax=Gordonia sp. KTR9 TaxID=337191 RepID=UPI00027DDFA6|nr:MoxR family ATPase [Gordonia sp. KTR9]AFR50645.1 MoxR-like ATPase [Gordonia sp. KTR9]
MTALRTLETHGLAAIRARIAAEVVGRDRELDLVLAAVAAGRDLILEGPPGTSKSTLLRSITADWGIPLVLVEGNADLTPGRLVGHHNPARVLREDYSPDNFVDGPLIEAMRAGGFLYVEEFNRAPEDTIDTLLTAMAERTITVPRVGTITAQPSFRIVASMNPFDNVGTTRLSTSVYDRMCRLVVDYQDDAAERDIVSRRTGLTSRRVVADAVGVTRDTRRNDAVRQGSSVRGAIDTALLAHQLCEMRGITIPADDAIAPPRDLPSDYTATFLDAMQVALSGRIHLDDTVFTTAEQVLAEIWQNHFLLAPAAAEPG